ncbi:MAG: hypothetical protein U0930_24285 [Pirellulales bacterium]
MKLARRVIIALALAFAFHSGAQASDKKDPETLSATHKQIQLFRPSRDNKPLKLNTFCLDASANILACTSDGQKHFLQTYSPDLKLSQEVELPFNATAVNVAKNGSIYVAGNGRIGKIASGKVTLDQATPNIGDKESLKARLEKMGKEQYEQYSESVKTQVQAIQDRIEKIEAKEADKISDRDKKRLATLKQQKQVYEESLQAYKDHFMNVDQLMEGALSVTALAVNSQNVFIACSSFEGSGYEVWKMKLDLSEPTRLLDKLGGCCGQFDIQVSDENLILAENTKFKVGLLDLEGKRLSDFGQSNRMGGEGFGSCCNPMNVRCCSNGDILTAESSIGTIKRYDKEGNLQAVIGKAKIGGGCKHVPLGYDTERDRYYMMYQDKNSICVLVPIAEAPEETADEKLAKEAKAGLGKQLVGSWSLDGKRPEPYQPPAAGENDGDIFISNVSDEDDPFLSKLMEFAQDGKLKTHTSELEWGCVRQENKRLSIELIMQGSPYDLVIDFTGTDEITISSILGDQVYSTKKYQRIKEADAQAEASSKKSGGE